MEEEKNVNEKIENGLTENVNKKEKKVNVERIIIAVLTVIICLLVGFIAYTYATNTETKNNNSKKDVTEEKKSEEKEKQLSEEEVKSYFPYIMSFINHFGFNEHLDIKDINNKTILQFALKNVYLVTKKYPGDGFTKDDIDSVITKFFGKDYKYTIDDVYCHVGDGVLYKYDSNTQQFSRVGEHPHGGGGGSSNKVFFVDAKESNDSLTIKVKILFGDYCSDSCGPAETFYANYKTGAIYKLDRDATCYSGTDEPCYDLAYEHVKDQLPISSFIYKKQSDGRFGLEKVLVE